MPSDAASRPAPLALGGACAKAGSECAPGTLCLPLFPGGYCTAPCGVVGGPCAGTCVESSQAGELCMKPCARDADCRAGEGYVCDPQWKACTVPNFVAIVPKQCPAAKGEPARDTAFAASEPWSTAKAPGVYQFEPAGALADDGGLVTVYGSRSAIFEGNKLGVARSDGTGAATIDAALAADRQSQFDPWAARGRDGTIYVVWYAFDGRDARGEIVLVTSRDRGATWSAPVAVHDKADCPDDGPPGCLDKPMIAIGPDPKDKKRELVYVFYSGGEGGLRVRTSRDGGATFGATSTALAGIYANVAIGADGRVHVVSLNGSPRGGLGSAEHKVEYASSSDAGATWTKAIVASQRDETLPFFFSNPSIVVDSARKWMYVAYVRGGRDAVWDLVITATNDGGKTWKRTSISDGCALHMVPNLALDPTTGTLHVAWYDSEGAIGRFAHATCTPGAAKCTRRGAINSVPFAALSTERHGAKWNGEYNVLIVDDKRRTLHAAWAQPVAEGDKVVSRIFHAKAKLAR